MDGIPTVHALICWSKTGDMNNPNVSKNTKITTQKRRFFSSSLLNNYLNNTIPLHTLISWSISVRCCRAMWSSPSHRASRVIWIPVAILSAKRRSNHCSAQLESTFTEERKGGLLKNAGFLIGLRQTHRQT